MANLDDVRKEPRKALFAMLADVHSGMLGLTASGAGLQPMTHFPDADAGVIWFISSIQSDLAQATGLGEDADYVVVGKDHDMHVSLRGKLYQLHDPAKLDALWNPVIAAWFEGGRDDPNIALLRFEPDTAELWASTASTLRFGFEILRANLDADHQPDFGVKTTVRFPSGA
jgi:general stress protein 26